MSLTTLPTELPLEILGHLDLESLLKTTATNKYFQALLKEDILRKALLSHEVVLLHHWRANHDASFWHRKKNRNRKVIELVPKLVSQRYQRQGVSGHVDAMTLRLFPFYTCYKVFRPHSLVLLIQRTGWDLCGNKAEERTCIRCTPARSLEFWETVYAAADVAAQKIVTKSFIQSIFKTEARRSSFD
jgi:hypothetical protein